MHAVSTPCRPEAQKPPTRPAETRPDHSLQQKAQGGWFRALAVRTSELTGHPFTFGLSLGVVLTWAATGPIFHYSDTWQLVINTGTTIVTFLMVFLIQATQNRDTTAIQLKLDELIRASAQANNQAIAAEELGDEAIARMKSDIRRECAPSA